MHMHLHNLPLLVRHTQSSTAHYQAIQVPHPVQQYTAASHQMFLESCTPWFIRGWFLAPIEISNTCAIFGIRGITPHARIVRVLSLFVEV